MRTIKVELKHGPVYLSMDIEEDQIEQAMAEFGVSRSTAEYILRRTAEIKLRNYGKPEGLIHAAFEAEMLKEAKEGAPWAKEFLVGFLKKMRPEVRGLIAAAHEEGVDPVVAVSMLGISEDLARALVQISKVSDAGATSEQISDLMLAAFRDEDISETAKKLGLD